MWELCDSYGLDSWSRPSTIPEDREEPVEPEETK